MQNGKQNLGVTSNVIRKIRIVRFIRKLIDEGIICRGVKELYEEGCRILSEMEKKKVEDEEEAYMSQLYLLKVRGIEKNMKEDEVEVLRREVRGLKKQLEAANKKIEEMKKKIPSQTPPPSNTPPPSIDVITSLDGASVIFTPSNADITRDGNTIINRSGSFRNCFIGGVMTSVYSIPILLLFSLSLSLSIYLRESIGCVYSLLPHSLSFHLSARSSSVISLVVLVSLFSFSFFFLYIYSIILVDFPALGLLDPSLGYPQKYSLTGNYRGFLF